MNTWTEIEDGYVTNQPLKFISSGKGRKKIPDPDKPPTEAFLFCYHCKKLKSGRIQRRRFLKTIDVTPQPLELDQKIADYISTSGVKLIETVDNPNKFISDGLEAEEIGANDNGYMD